MPIDCHKFSGIKIQFCFRPDSDSIVGDIFRDDEKRRTSSNLDSFSLSDGITERAFVCSEYFPTCIDDTPGLLWKAFLEKFFHTHFSYETEALAVFSLRVRESRLAGNLANLRFMEMSDRKERMRKLELIQSRQKICLVFIGIDSF